MDSLFPIRCQVKLDFHVSDLYSFFTVKSSYSNILATFNTITITQNWELYYYDSWVYEGTLLI